MILMLRNELWNSYIKILKDFFKYEKILNKILKQIFYSRNRFNFFFVFNRNMLINFRKKLNFFRFFFIFVLRKKFLNIVFQKANFLISKRRGHTFFEFCCEIIAIYVKNAISVKKREHWIFNNSLKTSMKKSLAEQ